MALRTGTKKGKGNRWQKRRETTKERGINVCNEGMGTVCRINGGRTTGNVEDRQIRQAGTVQKVTGINRNKSG